MKKVELKRFAEFLWKPTPSDEKTPLAQAAVVDNGSISKNSNAEDNKKLEKELPESESGKLEGPMSIPRKVCFMMSFNVWVLYFLVLGWIIPCRNLNCSSGDSGFWEVSLNSIWPLTNVETLNEEGLPSLAMLGYADGSSFSVAALATSDGAEVWNNNLSFIPRKIQCNFEATFDANGDGISDCLLSGYNDVYAYNASNGYVFWQRNLSSYDGNIVSKFHPTVERDGETYLIGTCGDQLLVLSATNGTKISGFYLPCSSPFEIRIVPNVIDKNLTLWHLVCDYGDKIEAWAFDEQDVLNVENSKDTAKASEFALLFSGSDSGGSIDLGCDVTSIPGGPLLLSWSDRVVMVTPKGTAWERRFPYPLAVAAINVGHFMNGSDLQVASAVHNGTDTILYILDANNGSTVDSIKLTDRRAQAIYKVPGDVDALVVKSLTFNYSSQQMYNFSDPIPREKTNFVLVESIKNPLDVWEISTTAVVVGSAVSTQMNGESYLLVLKINNGETLLQKYIIHNSQLEDSGLCIRVNHENHYAIEV